MIFNALAITPGVFHISEASESSITPFLALFGLIRSSFLIPVHHYPAETAPAE